MIFTTMILRAVYNRHVALSVPATVLALLLFALPAQAQVSVVSTIKPLQLIAGAITDGVSEVELLIPENQSYHHFNLRPSSMRALTSADLVIWVGPELETWLSDLIYQMPSRTQVITVGNLPGVTHHRFDSEVLLDAGPDGEHGSHARDRDPHVWLDTSNARRIAGEVAARLAELDAGNAGQYEHNLVAFVAALDAFDAENTERMAALSGRSYAVYHNAFQYFERQYGLQHELVIVSDDEMQPGMRHMVSVRQALQSRDLYCLLEDVTANPTTINAVLGRLTLLRVRADTLGHGLQAGAGGYLTLMENLSRSFQQCLSAD